MSSIKNKRNIIFIVATILMIVAIFAYIKLCLIDHFEKNNFSVSKQLTLEEFQQICDDINNYANRIVITKIDNDTDDVIVIEDSLTINTFISFLNDCIYDRISNKTFGVSDVEGDFPDITIDFKCNNVEICTIVSGSQKNTTEYGSDDVKEKEVAACFFDSDISENRCCFLTDYQGLIDEANIQFVIRDRIPSLDSRYEQTKDEFEYPIPQYRYGIYNSFYNTSYNYKLSVEKPDLNDLIVLFQTASRFEEIVDGKFISCGDSSLPLNEKEFLFYQQCVPFLKVHFGNFKSYNDIALFLQNIFSNEWINNQIQLFKSNNRVVEYEGSLYWKNLDDRIGPRSGAFIRFVNEYEYIDEQLIRLQIGTRAHEDAMDDSSPIITYYSDFYIRFTDGCWKFDDFWVT